jgi:hypothetical protein
MFNVVLLGLSGVLAIYAWRCAALTEELCTAKLSAFCKCYMFRFPINSSRDSLTSEAAPAFSSVKYEYVKFQGGLAETNKWKGQPSPELDNAWEEIVNCKPGVQLFLCSLLTQSAVGRVRVAPSNFEKLQKPATSVSYPSGEYQGGLEVFHQVGIPVRQTFRT